MPDYTPLRATTGGHKRCQAVSQGEQCTLALRRNHHPDGGHVYRRDLIARQTADRRARMAAIAAEGGERGAFFADLLAEERSR